MQDDGVQLFLRALKINRPLSLKIQSVVTNYLIYNIIQTSSYFHYPVIFQALYSFVFFSLLRLSDVLPHTMNSFDPSVMQR